MHGTDVPRLFPGGRWPRITGCAFAAGFCTVMACPAEPVVAAGHGSRSRAGMGDGEVVPVTRDSLAVLHDQLGVLGESLAQRDQAADKAAARRAASTAVEAIDAMLRELYPIRGRLVREIGHR